MIERDAVVTQGHRHAPGGSGAEQEVVIEHTVGAGWDKFLLAGIIGWGFGAGVPPDFQQVQWNGYDLLKYEFVADKGSGGNRRRVRMAMAFLADATPGVGQLYVRYALPAGIQPALVWMVRSYSGVESRSPFRAAPTTFDILSTSSPVSVAVPVVTANDYVVDLSHFTSPGNAVGPNMESDGEEDTGGTGHVLNGSHQNGSCEPSVTVQYDPNLPSGGVFGIMAAALCASPKRCFPLWDGEPDPTCASEVLP